MEGKWPAGRVVFLMGPTGSGKSSLAVSLSQILPVEIISVDSTLVYKGAKIGAARPSSSMLRRAKHHLIGVCSLRHNYSVAQFQKDASKKIAQIQRRKKIPVLVGGTGMYFRALENGLHFLPDKDVSVRKELITIAEKFGVSRLHEMLATIDPESARRINECDLHRLIRAIEVYQVSGCTMTKLRATSGREKSQILPIKFILGGRSRTLLATAVADRFDEMLERGLINEVSELIRLTGDCGDNQLLKSVGYKQVRAYLSGQINYSEMKRQAVVATCQLAKRQRTWFRKEVGAIWCDSASVNSDIGTMVELICSEIMDVGMMRRSHLGLSPVLTRV